MVCPAHLRAQAGMSAAASGTEMNGPCPRSHPQLLQQRPILPGGDSVRHGLQLQFMCHLQSDGQPGPVCIGAVHAGDIGTVDLDLGERDERQLLDRERPGAEIIERPSRFRSAS